MEKHDRCRKNIRMGRKFPVKLVREGLDFSFEGIAVNLSQKGAFIKTYTKNQITELPTSLSLASM
jgi:hypothetical protein